MTGEDATAETKVFLTRDDDNVTMEGVESGSATAAQQDRVSSAGEEKKIEKQLADKEKEVSYYDAVKPKSK